MKLAVIGPLPLTSAGGRRIGAETWSRRSVGGTLSFAGGGGRTKVGVEPRGDPLIRAGIAVGCRPARGKGRRPTQAEMRRPNSSEMTIPCVSRNKRGDKVCDIAICRILACTAESWQHTNGASSPPPSPVRAPRRERYSESRGSTPATLESKKTAVSFFGDEKPMSSRWSGPAVHAGSPWFSCVQPECRTATLYPFVCRQTVD